MRLEMVSRAHWIVVAALALPLGAQESSAPASKAAEQANEQPVDPAKLPLEERRKLLDQWKAEQARKKAAKQAQSAAPVAATPDEAAATTPQPSTLSKEERKRLLDEWKLKDAAKKAARAAGGAPPTTTQAQPPAGDASATPTADAKAAALPTVEGAATGASAAAAPAEAATTAPPAAEMTEEERAKRLEQRKRKHTEKQTAAKEAASKAPAAADATPAPADAASAAATTEASNDPAKPAIDPSTLSQEERKRLLEEWKQKNAAKQAARGGSNATNATAPANAKAVEAGAPNASRQSASQVPPAGASATPPQAQSKRPAIDASKLSPEERKRLAQEWKQQHAAKQQAQGNGATAPATNAPNGSTPPQAAPTRSPQKLDPARQLHIDPSKLTPEERKKLLEQWKQKNAQKQQAGNGAPPANATNAPSASEAPNEAQAQSAASASPDASAAPSVGAAAPVKQGKFATSLEVDPSKLAPEERKKLVDQWRKQQATKDAARALAATAPQSPDAKAQAQPPIDASKLSPEERKKMVEQWKLQNAQKQAARAAGGAQGPPSDGSVAATGPMAPPQLVGSYSKGDPIALALSDDNTRIFSVDGATLSILDATKKTLPTLAEIDLDAAVFAMQLVDKRLYVAGGTRGWGFVDLDTRLRQPIWIDVGSGGACTSIAVVGQTVYACFAAQGASELRAYHVEGFPVLGVARLTGKPLDLAVAPPHAYLALGGQGVARVDVSDPARMKVERGPDLSKLDAPRDYRLPKGFVRDVAVGDGSIFLAADVAGMVEIQLAKPWGRADSIVQHDLTFLGKPSYAIRVDARGDRVVVGATRGPAIACDGAPYGLLGRMGWDLRIGDVPEGSFANGASEGLWLFRKVEGGKLEFENMTPLENSGWRSLILRGKHVYEQHLQIGLVVREILERSAVAQAGDARVALGGGFRVVAKRQPIGLPAVEARASLRDPRILLATADSAGSVPRGVMRAGPNGLQPTPGLESQGVIGLTIGAQWLEKTPGVEWFVASQPRTWRLHRLSLAPKPTIHAWEIVPPEPLDKGQGGIRGHTYLHSEVVDDLLLCTRYGSRFGLVGYSVKALTAAAASTQPNKPLQVKPAWQVETHFTGEKSDSHTWRIAPFQLEDGRRIVAVAAGCNNDPKGAEYERPQVCLFDVSNGIASPARLLSVVHCEGKKGLALGVAVAQLQRRQHLFVASSNGTLSIHDVNDPNAPVEVGELASPPNVYDGMRDNFFDVEVWKDPASSLAYAFVAAGRAGVLRYPVAKPRARGIAPDATIDTPGWAMGLNTTMINGQRHLIVCDQKAGLRLYR